MEITYKHQKEFIRLLSGLCDILQEIISTDSVDTHYIKLARPGTSSNIKIHVWKGALKPLKKSVCGRSELPYENNYIIHDRKPIKSLICSYCYKQINNNNI